MSTGKFMYSVDLHSMLPAAQGAYKNGDILRFELSGAKNLYCMVNPITINGQLPNGRAYSVTLSGDTTDADLEEMVRQIKEARNADLQGTE